MRRFWTMLAHYHGQVWNGSEFARSIGTSEPTARRYLDILSGAFVVNQLQPWHENIKKRQVKSPKVYIRDTGLLHALLFLENDAILQHPKLGLSWEGFIVEELINLLGTPCYFWATHAGAELDLLTIQGGKRIGFEIKYTDAPQITKSMLNAMEDLSLDQLFIIYPGDKNYKIHEKIQVGAAKNLPTMSFSDTGNLELQG
jgi:predicted AAA+ superfamily ATPase